MVKPPPVKSGELTSCSSQTAALKAPTSDAFEVSSLTIYNVRKNYIEGGLKRAILRKKPDRVYPSRLDDEGEAHLISLACSQPLEGCESWSLRLLQDRMIRLEIMDNISN